MGKLIEQSLDGLFQGVSRQPDTIRLPGQVEEATNADLSVVTAGFSKRNGSIHISSLDNLTGGDPFSVHFYERDASEKYAVVIEDDDLHVYDLSDGSEATIAFPDGKTYLNSTDPENDFSFVTIADTTMILNKTVTIALAAAGSGTIDGSVQTFSDLPGAPSDGDIYRVTGDNGDAFEGYLVVWNGTDSVWEETVDPNAQNDFDAATMPHQLVRNSSGDFTFQEADWESREVGDATLVPPPDFVGQTGSDIYFDHDRFGIVAGETQFSSQTGDYFNFWPDSATDVKDSDPFGRQVPVSDVNLLKFAVAYRGALFLTSEKTQFEMASTSGTLTPRTAAMEPTTRYNASAICRPIAMADTLYFPSDSENGAVIWEYLLDDNTLTQTAEDVTKHVEGYIPDEAQRLAGDARTGTLFVAPTSQRHRLYLYRTYWQNNEKKQSAWSRWDIGESGDTIHGFEAIDRHLYLVVSRGSVVYLEKLPLFDEFGTSTFTITNSTGIIWPVRLDRRHEKTGTYSSGDDWTTWTLDYAHDDNIVAVLSDDWTSNEGRKLTVTYPTSTTVRVTGEDLSAQPVIFGKPYTMTVTFSKQYVRERDLSAITTGRFQLKRFEVDYERTGYFEVATTAKSRDEKTWTFSGMLLGDASFVVGETPIVEDGTFRARPKGNARDHTITIQSDEYLPATITSAKVVGFFNEITRQE